MPTIKKIFDLKKGAIDYSDKVEPASGSVRCLCHKGGPMLSVYVKFKIEGGRWLFAEYEGEDVEIVPVFYPCGEEDVRLLGYPHFAFDKIPNFKLVSFAVTYE